MTVVGDQGGAIRLGVFDEFNTPNRTYVTRVTAMPTKGTLLNADTSPIVADSNGEYWLSSPFEVLFVPTFNEVRCVGGRRASWRAGGKLAGWRAGGKLAG
jgi:hypothetical protein